MTLLLFVFFKTVQCINDIYYIYLIFRPFGVFEVGLQTSPKGTVQIQFVKL